MFKIEVNSLEELPAAASKFIDAFNGKKIFLFDAQMGAGKTTFIKELCHALGVMDNMSSPTYSIVNEYNYPEGKIYHFDLYRLKSKEELLDIGFETYLDSKSYCFIEWPDLAQELVDSNYMTIEIRVNNNIRYISLKHIS